MLYGLLLSFYILTCLLLILIILIQKSKSSVGFGLGTGSQMLFGGSGGQDLFQKITWVLGISFMAMSLLLSLMKSEQSRTLHRASAARSIINLSI
ncbi:MAG TPA: preprotein translocase subunit SecG [Patescibacteria group bacterium]|jgi:preprotein translocase subunit SecG|nr:preprotein translocase subunit SecG [Patescibacteria group bacterium]